MHTSGRSQKFGDAGPAAVERGVTVPLEARCCPTFYHTRFCRSRSNRFGLCRGLGWPMEICLSPACYRAKFGHSGSSIQV